MPRIWQVGIMDEHPTSNRPKNNQFTKRTFPVRFAHKFGKLSAGAKRGNSTQIYRGCAAVSREISARVCAKRFVPRRFVVWTLQRTQWRMVGQRTVQLWLVRSFFRALPFLAALAGPADARS